MPAPKAIKYKILGLFRDYPEIVTEENLKRLTDFLGGAHQRQSAKRMKLRRPAHLPTEEILALAKDLKIPDGFTSTLDLYDFLAHLRPYLERKCALERLGIKKGINRIEAVWQVAMIEIDVTCIASDFNLRLRGVKNSRSPVKFLPE